VNWFLCFKSSFTKDILCFLLCINLSEAKDWTSGVLVVFQLGSMNYVGLKVRPGSDRRLGSRKEAVQHDRLQTCSSRTELTFLIFRELKVWK